jgi:hypothetical protein
LWEVAEGNLGTAREARLQVSKQGRAGGKSGKDLEVGAVDELLVGEYVARARDKEEKNFTFVSPLASRLSIYIITNNIIY